MNFGVWGPKPTNLTQHNKIKKKFIRTVRKGAAKAVSALMSLHIGVQLGAQVVRSKSGVAQGDFVDVTTAHLEQPLADSVHDLKPELVIKRQNRAIVVWTHFRHEFVVALVVAVQVDLLPLLEAMQRELGHVLVLERVLPEKGAFKHQGTITRIFIASITSGSTSGFVEE